MHSSRKFRRGTLAFSVPSMFFFLLAYGNSMVLFAIVKSPRLRSMTNFFLANLAIADFCVGAFCVLPNLSTFLQPNWILGQAMCKVYYYIWNVSYTASIIIMTAIAIERYIAIIHPLKARHIMTKTKVKVVQIVIWLIAFIYNIPYLFFFDTFSFGGVDREYCYSDYANIYSLKGLSLVNLLFWYVAPLIIIGVLYYCVAIALWKTTVGSALRLQQYPDTDNTSFRSSRSSKRSNYDHESPHKSGNKSATINKRSIIRQTSSESELNPSQSSDNTVLCKGTHPRTVVFNSMNKSEVITPKITIKCLDSKLSDTYEDDKSSVELNYMLKPLSAHIGHVASDHKCHSDHNSHNGKRHTLDHTYRYRSTNLSSSRRVSQSRKKVIKLLIAVVVTFGICVLPHMMKVLNHYWHIYALPLYIDVILSPVSFVVLYLNSALNPILYALFSKTFRRGFRESLSCLWQHR